MIPNSRKDDERKSKLVNGVNNLLNLESSANQGLFSQNPFFGSLNFVFRSLPPIYGGDRFLILHFDDEVTLQHLVLFPIAVHHEIFGRDKAM